MSKGRTIDTSKYKWLEKGKRVWIENPEDTNPVEMFQECTVRQINEQKHLILVQNQNGKTTQVSLQRCLKCTYGESDVSDMVDLEELNQPQLLWNIKRRYDNDQIFTLCGPTLLIINPYRPIQKLFTNQKLYEYQSLSFSSETLQYKSLAPHIYGLAGFCLWQLFDNHRNQSIVISGQSGAGKTQNTKYCLKFLASLGKNLKQIAGRKTAHSIEARNILRKMNLQNSKLHGIEDKILGCNEILEAFGNAKTIRNDNSSRFGKLIILLYGALKVDIKSAVITNYLLQKSRIVSISKKQRNYHVFYYFCKGCSEEERKKYRLTEPTEKYYFLNQSDEYQVGNIKDDQMFEKLKTQFLLYLTPQEIDCVLSIVSAVLNLGNIEFSIRQNEKKQEFIVIKGEQFLKNVADLLNINDEQLSRALQFRKRTFKNEVTQSPFRLDEAIALRDSFAKNIYQKLFNFLVYKLNQKIQIQKIDLEDLANRSKRKSIGILDIFGFEILTNNSLEQFFINFANEKLQQLYVSYIFKQEQNEFNRQGLQKFSYQFQFQDNKPIIEMIEHYPEGIMHLINQASQLNKADTSLPQTIMKKHSKNNHVIIPKFKNQHFLIHHSCSSVEYSSKGFIAKNKDQFPAQMSDLINKIESENMKSIITFDSDKGKQMKGTGKKFLATKFLNQINNLVQELYSSDCHFVRCIKPNQIKKPRVFTSGQVLQSLRNLGVLDSIKIRKLGYVYRRPFKQFTKKFYDIQAYNYNYNKIIDQKSEDELKQMVKRIVMKYAPQDMEQNHILIGHNKILINQLSLNNFEMIARQKRRTRINVSNRFKQAYKKHLFREQVSRFLFTTNILKHHLTQLKAQVTHQIKLKKICRIQQTIKNYLTKVRYKKIEAKAKQSVSTIMRWWRLVNDRKKFLEAKQKTVLVQAHLRKYLTTLKMFRQTLIRNEIKSIVTKAWAIIENNNAILIQKIFRGHHTRIKFKEEIKKIQIAKEEALLRMRIITIQKWWRFRLFKINLNRYTNAVQKIQATYKAYLIRRVYKEVQKSVRIIQRVVKKHIGKKYQIGKLWKNSNLTLKEFQVERYKELHEMGVTIKPTKNPIKYYLDSVSTKLQVMSPIDSQSFFIKQSPSAPSMNLSSFYIPHQDKNDFQSCLLDIDIVSSVKDYYEQRWGYFYKTVLEGMKQKMQYPIKIQVSNNFTCIVSQKGKVYQFGEVHSTGNKEYNVIDKGIPYKLICTQFSGYLLNTERQLYTWGDNDSDQLMRGYQSAPAPYQQNDYLPLQRINNVEVKGKNKYLISFGRVYQYTSPATEVFEGQKFKLTRQLLFPSTSKIIIQQIVASYNFVHFLTNSGQLYSKGNNDLGELGLGHSQSIHQPTHNKFMKQSKEIIDSVSVGYRHTICKTRLGYVYAWGDNSYKQVVDNPISFVVNPYRIEAEKATKAYGAVAGFRCSAVLLQNSKVYHWGTNSTISKSGFQRLEFQKIYQLNNTGSSSTLVPLKLCSTWSSTMSIIYINALNQFRCKKTVTKQNIIKTIKNVCKEWTPYQIFPSYNQMAQNNLNLSDLKKYKFKNLDLRPSQYEDNIKNPFKEIDLLIHAKGQTDDVSYLNMTAKEKLEEMFKILLEKKQDQQWTEEERRLFAYLQNPKIQKLIRNL